jgi:hypothetical protein
MARYRATAEGNVPFTAAEEEEADIKELAWIAGADTRAFADIREERNTLIAETDWRFRSDLTPSQEWIAYCQALRDFPSVVDLTAIVWPTPPI